MRRGIIGTMVGLVMLLCGDVRAAADESAMATLRLTSEPAATFSINHRPGRTGDAVIETVRANEPLLISVSAPGWQTQYRTLALGPGERRHEAFKLSREPIPVLFRATTPVTVLCNGEVLGEAPCYTFFEQPKVYRIVMRASGFQEQALSLNLTDGRPRVIDAALVADSGTLKVDTTPAGARVLVNGVERGTTPCTLARMREGEHTLQFRLEGYKPLTHRLSVTAGESLSLSFPLERLPAGLSIATIPEGARVYVDGVFRGESDLVLQAIEEGEHAIRVEKPGYLEVSRRVMLKSGQAQVEEFRLQVVRGILSVRTQPASVTVFNGSRRLLTTEPEKKDDFTSKQESISLPPGVYRLTLKADGYATAERQVEIRPNQTAELNVRLEFKPNFLLETREGSYRGVFVKQSEANATTLELKPGYQRTFKQEEIIRQQFLKDEP